jgi:hypothetical protein
MKPWMNKNRKIKLVIAIMVALFLVRVSVTIVRPDWMGPPRRLKDVPHDPEFYYKEKTILTTINAGLLLILLGIHFDIYKKTKSEFTIGMMTFSMALLLFALTSNPLLYQRMGYYETGLGPFAMLPHLFTFFASVILLYLSRQ